jgi:hypothetical protein
MVRYVEVLIVFVLAATGCFSDVGTSHGGETRSPECPVRTEGCPCGEDGACEDGLLCVEARCVAIEPGSEDDGETTVSATSTTSTASTSSSSSTSSTSSTGAVTTEGTELGSTDLVVCDGTCSECLGCAMEGPCVSEASACLPDECGSVPFCLSECGAGLHSCQECCLKAPLQLAEALLDCVEQQCGTDCSFAC